MKFKEAEMKKIILLMSIIFSLNIIACSDDDGSKADLQWNNQGGEVAKDIKWMSDSTVDQRWDGEYNNGDTTPFKGIKALTGQGECVDISGDTAVIEIDPYRSVGIEPSSSTSTAVVQENAAATLIISSIATTK